MATVARAHGLKLPAARIRQMAGTDARGTTVLGMVQAGQKLGFDAKAVRSAKDAIGRLQLPAIFHVHQGNLSHFVVVHEIRRKEVIVADPALGIVKISIETFLERWTGVAVLLVPATTFEPGEYTRSPWQRFAALLQPHDFLLAECFLLSLFVILLGLGFSLYLQLLTDYVLKNRDWQLLRWATVGLLIVIVCKAVLGQLRGVLLAYISRKIDVSLMAQYYRHVLRLPMQFFDSRHTGEIISRLTDAVKIREALSGTTLILLVDSATMFGLLGLLFFYSAKLALVIAAAVPLLGLIAFRMNGPLRRYQRRTMEHAATFQSHLVENFGGISAIKAANAEEDSTVEAERLIVRMLNALFRASLWAISLSAATELILGLALAGVLWGAGVMLLRGQFTIGQLVAFYSIALFMFQPMLRLVTVNQTIQDASVAASRLCEIFDLAPETAETGRRLELPASPAGEIRFRNVSFAYPGRMPVLEGINLTFPPRSATVILGESGSGKSTLAKLLMRYYEPGAGSISLDGINLADTDIGSLRSVIGLVDQESTVFSGTIESNLLLGNSQFNLEKVLAAIHSVGLEEFINHLPRRFQTDIGSRGTALSGGQRQRLAIARALISDARIMIFDEATSNLDLRSEREILDLISRLKSAKTVIVIAHRLSTLAVADQVVLLEKGRVAWQGPVDEFGEEATLGVQLRGLRAVETAAE